MSFSFGKIFVPVDPTKVSVAAWKFAEKLGAEFGAKVEGVFVQDLHAVEAEGFYSGRIASLLRDASLKAIRQRLGKDAAIEYRFGDPATWIAKEIRKKKPDLVVMGTHQRAGFDRFLMGSISEEIVRSASAPVLVMRKKPKRIRSILAPVHFKPYARKGLRFALEFAEAVDAKVTPLHVVESLERPEAARRGMRALLAGLPKRFERRLRPPRMKTGKAVTEILKAAKKEDLLVLSAHRRFFLQDVVLGTTAERVVRLCETGLLTVPAGATS